VQVLDAALAADDRTSILAGCDAYVSLHRSEGFGMTMAEAMAYGRPVVATAFGGNLEFADDTTAFLVDCRPAPVSPGVPIYPEGMLWAEPDLDHAAALLRRVVDDPAEAAARGRRGRDLIRSRHSPEAVGEVVAREIERLSRLPDPPGARRHVAAPARPGRTA
jgi:glycosyltransferase involved in cell wall biosynthesis